MTMYCVVVTMYCCEDYGFVDYVKTVLSLLYIFYIVFVVTCFGGSPSREAAKTGFVYINPNIFVS
jgi:hypothetical protein